MSFQPFEDDEDDSGYREARRHLKEASLLTASLESFSSPSSLSSQEIRELSPFQTSSSSPSSSSTVSIMEITKSLEEEEEEIKDYRTATAASSRAAVAAYAAYNAIAMTQAAAARAATRAAKSAQQAAVAAAAALQQSANAAQEKEVEDYKSFATSLSSPPPSEAEVERKDKEVPNEMQDDSEPPIPPLTLDVSMSSVEDIGDSATYPSPSSQDIDRLNRLFEESTQEEAAKGTSGEKRDKSILKGEGGGDDSLTNVAIQQVWGLVDWAKGVLPKGLKEKEEQGVLDGQVPSSSLNDQEDLSRSSSNGTGGGFWSFFKR